MSFEENMYGHLKKTQFILDELQKLERPHENIRVFDFGCGTGEMVTSPVGVEGYSVIGLDFHKASIDRAIRQNSMENIRFFCGTLDEFHDAEKFDCIICSEVLEHLSDPREVLLKLKSLMKDSGILIVTIPNGYGPFEIEQFFYHLIGDERVARIKQVFRSTRTLEEPHGCDKHDPPITMTENDECGHIQFFTIRTFSRLVSECGFKIKKIESGAFMCGSLSNYLLKKYPRIVKLNVRIAPRYLPHTVCSDWFFVLDKKTQ